MTLILSLWSDIVNILTQRCHVFPFKIFFFKGQNKVFNLSMILLLSWKKVAKFCTFPWIFTNKPTDHNKLMQLILSNLTLILGLIINILTQSCHISFHFRFFLKDKRKFSICRQFYCFHGRKLLSSAHSHVEGNFIGMFNPLCLQSSDLWTTFLALVINQLPNHICSCCCYRAAAKVLPDIFLRKFAIFC